MSELKVWVDGKERIICGVSEDTTCESVILVLAKAAKKSGKVALLEKWRDYERILPPDENPIKCFEAWGAYKTQVLLILQDEESNSTTNQRKRTSINLITDDNFDVIKDSIDCESLEDLTSLQQRKLQRLARAIEIIGLEFSYWDNSEEAFLYLTEEEIIEDLSVKLSHVLKLQAKELVELETWNAELNKLQRTYDKLSSKRELTVEKIGNIEAEIAESCSAIEGLMSEVKTVQNEDEMSLESARRSAMNRDELMTTTRELDKQTTLFLKQEQELDSISSSLSELEISLRRKNSEIKHLKNEIEKDSEIYDISEDFRPQIPEAESKSTSQGIRHSIGLPRYLEPVPPPSLGLYSGVQDYSVSNSPATNSEFQELSSESENRTDSYPSTKPKTSLNTSVLKDKLQHFHVSRTSESSPSIPSLLHKNKFKDTDVLATFSSENQKSSERIKFENRPNVMENSASHKEFSPISQLDLSTKASEKPARQVSLLTSPIHHDMPFLKKEESVKMMKDSIEKPVSQGTRSAPKPPTKPKPKRKHIGALQQGSATASSIQSQHNQSIYSTKDNFKLISAPMPYGSQSSGFRSTSKVSTRALSHSHNSKTHLSPPTVSNKRTNKMNHKLINNDDLAEQGVFV